MHGCSGLLFFHSKPSGARVSLDLSSTSSSMPSKISKWKTWSASSFCHHRIGFLTNANEKVGANAMFLYVVHFFITDLHSPQILKIWHRGPRLSQLNALTVLQVWHMFVSLVGIPSQPIASVPCQIRQRQKVHMGKNLRAKRGSICQLILDIGAEVCHVYICVCTAIHFIPLKITCAPH